MAGTIKRTGAAIARRATAAGLGSLAVAVFVGVVSFAFTTSAAGQATETSAQFLPTASKLAELQMLSSTRPEILQAAAVTVVPVNEQALLASRAISAGDQFADSDEEVSEEETQAVAAAVAAPNTAPDPAPDLAPGDTATATISFYYCEQGVKGLHPGDGGGFCGVMRDGTVVYPGAAACAYRYLGQQFRIVGDPTRRIYTCADTGSAVLGLHRDIWFFDSDEGWTWQLEVGQVAAIEILP